MRNSLVGLLSLVLLISACGRKPEAEPVVTGVSYVGATVADLERTKAMYVGAASLDDVQALDLENVKAFDALIGRDDVRASTRMLRSVNAQIRYMQFDQTSEYAQQVSPVPVQGPGIAHICFQVNGKTRTYERFLDNGARHIGAREMQQVNPRNPVDYAYVTDHDGLIVEVEHVDLDKLDLDVKPQHDHRIRHVSLATPNIKRLKKFYARFLGQDPRFIGRFRAFGNDAMSHVSGLPGTKVKMAWFQTRNLEIELIQYASHPTDQPEIPRPLDAKGYNMIVFDVTNLDDASRAFEAAGGSIISAPEPLDGGQIVFGRDPDLNLIGLQLPAPDSIVSSSQFKNNGT